MPQSIDYQKQMTEIVYINLPGPGAPEPGMSGGELLHGFLSELYMGATPEVKEKITDLCGRWNVFYRKTAGSK